MTVSGSSLLDYEPPVVESLAYSSVHAFLLFCRKVYDDLVKNGVIVPAEEVPPPTVPMDYSWARVLLLSRMSGARSTNHVLLCIQELGLIRKPASFMTSISDERGQELLYAGMPISKVFKEDLGIGGVLGLLWFQKRCGFVNTNYKIT